MELATIAISAGGVLTAVGIAWGTLRNRVNANSKGIEALWRHKQDARTCAAMHQAIMRELNAINKKLDSMK